MGNAAQFPPCTGRDPQELQLGADGTGSPAGHPAPATGKMSAVVLLCKSTSVTHVLHLNPFHKGVCCETALAFHITFCGASWQGFLRVPSPAPSHSTEQHLGSLGCRGNQAGRDLWGSPCLTSLRAGSISPQGREVSHFIPPSCSHAVLQGAHMEYIRQI